LDYVKVSSDKNAVSFLLLAVSLQKLKNSVLFESFVANFKMLLGVAKKQIAKS
jgi:hypothetical protein